MTPAHSTVAVELTPAGRGAVAVVLIAGPDAVRVVGECFAAASGRRLAEIPLGRIALGRWGGADGEELVVCRRAEMEVEVHCHGGMATVQAILRQLVESGCLHVTWQEWVRRSGRDPTRAAAQIALAEAPTERTAAILLDQSHGALSQALREAASAVGNGNWSQAADVIDRVLRFGEAGLHLTSPWRVVLAGPPNVGKSSLINAIAGYQRAIVSPVPGTTRDIVTASMAIDGWPVLLADTAGLRATQDELEAAGVALAAATLENADLAVVVRDRIDNAIAIDHVPEAARRLQVLNKIDLLPTSQRCELPNDMLLTSAVTGEGIAELITAIARALVPIAPGAGEAVPFRPEHIAAIESARQAIERQDAATAEAALQSLLAPEAF